MSTLPAAWVEVTPNTLSALSEQPDVVAILPNQGVEFIRPREVDYSELAREEIEGGFTWGLARLDIPKLWERTTGRGINVAVIDTGVYGDHPALASRIGDSDFVFIDPLGRRITAKPIFDSDQHGTHVCGTIAGGKTSNGISIGVAPEARLLVASMMAGGMTVRTLFEGISWAAEKGADIINLSLGSQYYEPLFVEVFEMLLDLAILPIVAIGNESFGNTSSPGNAYNALSVGAVGLTSGGREYVAPFSSGASLVFPERETNDLVTKPDVVAPGVQVYSCIPPGKRSDGPYQYAYMDGTSMATPHVAGAAALLMAAKPEAPPADIIKVLKETAWRHDGTQHRPDNRWGYGLIQPSDALRALG
jgi:serine protease AprX